jgi:hypothetical protein
MFLKGFLCRTWNYAADISYESLDVYRYHAPNSLYKYLLCQTTTAVYPIYINTKHL